MSGGVLVAGIGNLFLSDDAFGVEVANRLAARPVPPGVRVVDFGIRGVHLAYELLDGYDGLILVDAVPMGEEPGTVAVIEPQPDGALGFAGDTELVVDAHSMSPEVVLATLARLGGHVERVYVVGCQPASLEEGIGLSASVAAAVDGAVELCGQLLAEMVPIAGKGTSP
jgi:hydrogenase maturation protease